MGPCEAHSGHGQGGWEKCRKRSPLPGLPSWGLPLGSLGVSPESQHPESVSQSIEFWFHSGLISLFLCPHPQLGLQLKATGDGRGRLGCPYLGSTLRGSGAFPPLCVQPPNVRSEILLGELSVGPQSFSSLSDGHPSSSALEDQVSSMKEGRGFPDSPYQLGPSELHPVSPGRLEKATKPNQAGSGGGTCVY